MVKYFPVTTAPTAKAATSVDSVSYSYSCAGITATVLAENPVYVKDANNQFYKILFVVGGTAYLARPMVLGNGVKIKDVTNNTVKTLKVETEYEITLV